METPDSIGDFDECILCFGKMRRATRREVEERLRAATPEYRAAVRHSGTWYVCPECGPNSAVKWQTVSLK
jgi:hypothetical protein